MSKFTGEIKRIVIDEGKEVAEVKMLIPKGMALKIEMGVVDVEIKTAQKKMFEDTKE